MLRASSALLIYHTESRSIAAPNATVPVHGLSVIGAEADIDFMLAVKGDGAYSVQVPDNANAGGNKRGPGAVDFQRLRNNADQVAAGTMTVQMGTQYCRAGITGAGNYNSYNCKADAGWSVNLASTGCTTSETYAINISSQNCTASGQYAHNIGSYSSTASGANAATLACSSSTVTGAGSAAIACVSTSVGGIRSVATGGTRADDRGLHAANTHGTYDGKGRKFELVLSGTTTDAAATKITSGGGAFGTTGNGVGHVYVLKDQQTCTFTVRVSANGNKTADSTKSGAGFIINGAVRRAAGVGTIVLVGTPTVTAFKDTALDTATANVVVDTTNGCLHVEVAGVAGIDVQWNAVIFASESI